MSRPRVIFVSTVFDDIATGPALYAQLLWRAFRDDPVLEFHAVVPRSAEQHPRLHAVDFAGDARGSSSVYDRVCRAALELTTGRELETIVHGNMAHAMGGMLQYAGPMVVQVNDYEVASLPHRWPTVLRTAGPRRVASLVWRRRQEARMVRAASMTVANSEFTREAVIRAYDVEPSRVRTIHKAVDIAAFLRPPLLPPDPFPGRAPGQRLLFIGSNWVMKGLDVLLEAIASARGTCPDMTLVVAGDGGMPANRRIRQLAQRLGLSDRVTFAERVARDTLTALLWHSDLFVLPSRSEAFGVSILEAMAAEIPVVASRVGGIPEIIRDGIGMLVEPGDSLALAAAITQILNSPQRRAALASAGPARAACFGIARMTDAVREMYLELASNVSVQT